ncbi:MAG: helix-turn-helix transcriptional regulator [Bacteroidetes bacterium]|nr:helix-turn-helix transcriptional regulator [Bacteroidota bacterium]MBX7046211.1 helix-turn-helix transcriptional regulator [Ignavibacteria bacterium]
MNSKKTTTIEQFVINTAREKRMQRNISQSELAHMLDVSPGFIGKVESSKHTSKYNLNHVNKLAEIFNCSPRAFLPEHPFSA